MTIDDEDDDDGTELKSDVVLTVRISRELRDTIYDVARCVHRSMNAMMTVFAEDGLEALGKWPPHRETPKRPPPWQRHRKKEQEKMAGS
jgi:hypothetical protein